MMCYLLDTGLDRVDSICQWAEFFIYFMGLHYVMINTPALSAGGRLLPFTGCFRSLRAVALNVVHVERILTHVETCYVRM